MADDHIPIDDYHIPIANIAKIVKKALPPDADISYEAMMAIQHSLTEFVSFITSEAAFHSMDDKRKTLNGEHIVHALDDIGFDNYSNVLRLYLKKWNEVNRKDVRQGKKARFIAADEFFKHHDMSSYMNPSEETSSY
jgi:histone H3/H4